MAGPKKYKDQTNKFDGKPSSPPRYPGQGLQCDKEYF